MRIFYWIIKILILCVLFFFSVQNMHSVKFNIFAEHGISLPLVILMLISLTVGAILGVFAMLGRVLSLRSEVNSLKRAKKKAEKIAGKLEESISSKDNE